jgi:hypothetical protein
VVAVFEPLVAEVEVVLDHARVEEVKLDVVVKMGSLVAVVMSIEERVVGEEDEEKVGLRAEELPDMLEEDALVLVDTGLMLQLRGSVDVLVETVDEVLMIVPFRLVG